MVLSAEWLFILFFVGLFSGFIGSIAGSGGMITLPVLLWAGVPPVAALATNKFQASFGIFSAAFNYYKKGLIDFSKLWPAMIYTFIGACIGTLLVQYLDDMLLSHAIPFLILAVTLYFLFSSKISDSNSTPKISVDRFNAIAGSSVGVYGGFFGPATGTFFIAAFNYLLGYNVKSAAANTKPLSLVVYVTSVTIFIISEQIIWLLALLLAVAQYIGAYLGSSMVINKGVRFIKPMVIVITSVVAMKLIFDNYSGYFV